MGPKPNPSPQQTPNSTSSFFLKRGFYCLWSTVNISHYLWVPGLLDGGQSPGRTSGWGSLCSTWRRNGDKYRKVRGVALPQPLRTLLSCLSFSTSPQGEPQVSPRGPEKSSSSQDLKYFGLWPGPLPGDLLPSQHPLPPSPHHGLAKKKKNFFFH